MDQGCDKPITGWDREPDEDLLLFSERVVSGRDAARCFAHLRFWSDFPDPEDTEDDVRLIREHVSNHAWLWPPPATWVRKNRQLHAQLGLERKTWDR